MHLIASAFATRRSRFTFALTAGTLALVIGLVVYGSLSRPTGYPGPKSLTFLLIPLTVYLVCRFARSAVMVPVLALLLVGAAVWSIPPLDSPTDEWRWVQIAAFALSGAGLPLKVRWAPYVWYATVLGFAMAFADNFVDGARGQSSPVTLLGEALLLLTIGFGGSAAVAARAKGLRMQRAAPSSGARWLEYAFALLCIASAALAAWQWQVQASRFADADGTEKVHRSLKRWVKGGSNEPMCDKLTFCGDLVQMSCHPEVDGLVSFHNNRTGALVMNCGGACMNGGRPGTKDCGVCPPPEWEQCVSR